MKIFNLKYLKNKFFPNEDNKPLITLGISGSNISPIFIATTDGFDEEQRDKGNFFPLEQKEDIMKIHPVRSTKGSAGIDLKAYITKKEQDELGNITIQRGETKLITTGFNIAIPEGYFGMVCSRSGLSLKNSVFVLNAPGIIDSDYRGELAVILHNAGNKAFTVSTGDRIAQMVIVKNEELPLCRVSGISTTETERGAGGFGSTGK